MAIRIPVQIDSVDSDVFLDRVSGQITVATAPSVGTNLCYVLEAVGADEGVYVKWAVPKGYSSTPKLVIRGILDGAPGAGDDLGFAVREHIAADNETADGTFATAQTIQNTDIGSTGSNHSDEDVYEASITLTATYAEDDDVFAYVFIDDSGTTYGGNFLLTGIFFEYTPT